MSSWKKNPNKFRGKENGATTTVLSDDPKTSPTFVDRSQEQESLVSRSSAPPCFPLVAVKEMCLLTQDSKQVPETNLKEDCKIQHPREIREANILQRKIGPNGKPYKIQRFYFSVDEARAEIILYGAFKKVNEELLQEVCCCIAKNVRMILDWRDQDGISFAMMTCFENGFYDAKIWFKNRQGRLNFTEMFDKRNNKMIVIRATIQQIVSSINEDLAN